MYALWSDGAYDVQTIVTALFVIAIVFMVFRKFFR